MTLSKQHEATGLTYGQIIATLTLLFLIFGAWINLTNETIKNKTEIENLKADKDRLRLELKDFINENKQDHKILADKIDNGNYMIIELLKKK